MLDEAKDEFKGLEELRDLFADFEEQGWGKNKMTLILVRFHQTGRNDWENYLEEVAEQENEAEYNAALADEYDEAA